MTGIAPDRSRLGALSLGAAALLLALFPLIRPYVSLDPRAPEATMAAMGPVVASSRWVAAHAVAIAGFVLLMGGLAALAARLRRGGDERARRALTLSIGGIALILPSLGVETYVVPVIGRLYVEGLSGIAPITASIYLGPTLWVLALGWGLLVAGGASFAGAIRRDGSPPRWAGVGLAVGFTFWLPVLPPPVRMADGLLIGISGLALAWSLGTERVPRGRRQDVAGDVAVGARARIASS